jgi:hypothetical protein
MFYVYAYLDKSKPFDLLVDNVEEFQYVPIYIGKGKGRRAYEHLHYRNHSNLPIYNKLNKMISSNNHPLIIIVKEFLVESDAFEYESFLIQKLGKIKDGSGVLYNLTNGGEGISGYKHTEETVKNMKHKSITENHHLRFPKSNGSNHPMFGKNHTKEAIDKISKSKIGRKQSKETIEKRIGGLRGISLSKEHKVKISNSHKGKKFSSDTIKKCLMRR